MAQCFPTRSTISYGRFSARPASGPAPSPSGSRRPGSSATGWAKHVTVEVALGTREGTSVRGGAMGHLHEGALADAGSVDKVIDAAVASVAARHGISVALPSAGGGGGATVDAAALSEFTDQITGRDGVLASAARLVLGQLGLDDPVSALGGRRVHRCRAHRPGHRRIGCGLATFGGAGVRRQEGRRVRRPLGQRPRGPGQAVADRRGRHRRRLDSAVGAVRGCRSRRCDSGHLVAGQGAGRGPSDPRARCTAGSRPAPRTRTPVPTATKSPS